MCKNCSASTKLCLRGVLRVAACAGEQQNIQFASFVANNQCWIFTQKFNKVFISSRPFCKSFKLAEPPFCGANNQTRRQRIKWKNNTQCQTNAHYFCSLYPLANLSEGAFCVGASFWNSIRSLCHNCKFHVHTPSPESTTIVTIFIQNLLLKYFKTGEV